METLHECNQHCKTLASLTLIQDEAQRLAYKYRNDPFLSRLHTQYAEAIDSVIEQGKGGLYV